MSHEPATPAPRGSAPQGETATDKKADASLLTVLVALGANVLIAIAKSVAAALTGSASMVAEAAHSWADSGNEVFLLVAERKSDQAPDESHPMGYGREGYVWSMFAAFGLFTAGSVVSIYHGIQQLGTGEPESSYTIAYVVLAVSFVLEGTSFLQARREAAAGARRSRSSLLRYVWRTSNPTLRAVFAEDSAALLGLVIAAVGIALHEFTGMAVFDAVGSIAVGVLLGVIAIFLIARNRDFLTGQAVSPRLRALVLQRMLAHPEINRVTYLHLEYVGADRMYLVAAVDLEGDAPESRVAEALRRLEAELAGHETIQRAVLTLSAPDEPSLQPPRA